MRLIRLSYAAMILLSALMAAAAPAATTPQAPQTQPVTRDSTRDTWKIYRESCRLILRGQFDAGYAALQTVLDDGEANLPNASVLAKWVAGYEDLASFRKRLHTTEYDTYVNKAKDYAAEADWSKAMDLMASAFWSAKDEDRFREEPWLKEFVGKAFDYAEDLRKRGEWADAARMYAELALVYPDNKQYKDLRTRCAAHATLEAMYGEDADWRDRVEGITPLMAQDAFMRIEKYYYDTPDLGKMAASGIDRLIILAETTSLFKTFEGLSSPEKRLQFIARLQDQADKVDAVDDLTATRLNVVLNSVLQASGKTVEIPDEVIISEFVDGAFDSLDNYSSMIWPAEQAEFRKHTTGEFSGVGIQISMDGDRITVFSPLEDTPAYKAGIEPGDTIAGIDGKPVKGITLQQAVRRITGKAGTQVTLTIERQTVAKPFDVTIKRDKITVPTVKGWQREGFDWNYWIDEQQRIAYVRVTSFTETTTDAFRETLKRLDKEGMNGLIVDLRVNPGGLLKTAVELSEMFLPPGQDIVSTRGRASEPWRIQSRSGSEFAGLPLIILINDYSASASEIMAGALHAHGRALLVGERTWGKGSVQNPWPLGTSDSMLKLTTALYYLPFMTRSIHRQEDSKEWGVQPDMQVKLTPKEARRVLELRRDSDVLPGKSGALPTATAPASQPDGEEPDASDLMVKDLQVDPQIETALLLMRVRLLSKEPWSFRMASASAGETTDRLQRSDTTAN